MNNQQTIDAILAAVRNAEGNRERLMELSFGCLLADGSHYVTNKDKMWAHTVMVGDMTLLRQNYHADVVGHPVQWSDVLVAIMNVKTNGRVYCSVNSPGVLVYGEDGGDIGASIHNEIAIDLTVLPEQAMHNDPQLVTFLAEVLNVKE